MSTAEARIQAPPERVSNPAFNLAVSRFVYTLRDSKRVEEDLKRGDVLGASQSLRGFGYTQEEIKAKVIEWICYAVRHGLAERAAAASVKLGLTQEDLKPLDKTIDDMFDKGELYLVSLAIKAFGMDPVPFKPRMIEGIGKLLKNEKLYEARQVLAASGLTFDEIAPKLIEIIGQLSEAREIRALAELIFAFPLTSEHLKQFEPEWGRWVSRLLNREDRSGAKKLATVLGIGEEQVKAKAKESIGLFLLTKKPGAILTYIEEFEFKPGELVQFKKQAFKFIAEHAKDGWAERFIPVLPQFGLTTEECKPAMLKHIGYLVNQGGIDGLVDAAEIVTGFQFRPEELKQFIPQVKAGVEEILSERGRTFGAARVILAFGLDPKDYKQYKQIVLDDIPEATSLSKKRIDMLSRAFDIEPGEFTPKVLEVLASRIAHRGPTNLDLNYITGAIAELELKLEDLQQFRPRALELIAQMAFIETGSSSYWDQVIKFALAVGLTEEAIDKAAREIKPTWLVRQD